jgi:hypothetical protein
MPRHAHTEGTETPEIDPLSPEAIIQSLKLWENEHLAKMDPKQANVEFGMVAGLIQQIGERCNRRLIAATSGKCGGCGKPIQNNRVFNQVSVFNKTTGKFDEKYACSSKCSDKLVDEQHRNAIVQQTEA